jgi:hypothetical protein
MNEVCYFYFFDLFIKIFCLDIDDKMINTQIDPSTLPRSINIDNSVSSPAGTATDLSVYEVSLFRYFVDYEYIIKYSSLVLQYSDTSLQRAYRLIILYQ